MLSNQQHKLCAYRNPEKSRQHQDADGKFINQQGYDFCEFDQAYIAPGQSCTAGDDIIELIEIFCKNCHKKLCQYKVLPGHKAHELAAIVDFRYTENLFSYRPRPDGVLGLECSCGNSDTRLSDDEKKKAPNDFPPFVRSSSTESATVGHKKSDFSYNKRRSSYFIPDRGIHGKVQLPEKRVKP